MTDEKTLQEVARDLPLLFGRASLEGHEAGQRLAREVQAQINRVIDRSALLGQVELTDHITSLVNKHGTLTAVAEMTEVDLGYLSRLKAGKRPNPSDETLLKLGLERRIGFALANKGSPRCMATPVSRGEQPGAPPSEQPQ